MKAAGEATISHGDCHKNRSMFHSFLRESSNGYFSLISHMAFYGGFHFIGGISNCFAGVSIFMEENPSYYHPNFIVGLSLEKTSSDRSGSPAPANDRGRSTALDVCFMENPRQTRAMI